MKMYTLHVLTACCPSELMLVVYGVRQTSSRAGTVEDSSAARTEPSRWGAVWNWRVYLLGAMDGLEGSAKYGIIYWAPLIIASILTGSANGGQSLDANQASSAEHTPSPVFVVLLAAIPFGFAAGFTLLNAYHSKRTGNHLFPV